MALGKAFIEVHADTKPFARELGRDLDKIIKGAAARVRESSRGLGESIGDEVSKGIKKSSPKVRREVGSLFGDSKFGKMFSRFSVGIIDTIDDGISGLPTELKAVLGTALIAVAPLALAIGSAIATGILAGLTLGGLAAVGALIGSQFVEVRDRFTAFVSVIRDDFGNATQWLAGPVIGALDMVEARIQRALPLLTDISEKAGQVLIPVVDALLGLVEQFLPGFGNALAGIDRFFAPLQVGFRLIGKAAGQFFDEILNDDDAPQALYDTLIIIEDLIQGLTALIGFGLDFYGVVRDIVTALGFLKPYTDDIKKFSLEFNLGDEAIGRFTKSVKGTLPPLAEQVEAIEAVNKQLDTLTNLMFAQVDNEIAFEQALDDFTESVRENGRSLDITGQAGRNNSKALLELAHTALKTRADTIALTGEVDTAQRAFEKQKAEIYAVAAQMRLSKADTEALIGALLRIPPPAPTGVEPASAARLREFLMTLQAVLGLLPRLGGLAFGAGLAVPAIPAYGDGTITDQPHMAMVGDSPEAIIPLNDPARAAELMNASGLSQMASTNVNVFIGNDQINAHVDRRVDRRMAVTARTLAYGSRSL